MIPGAEFAVVDVETTGLFPGGNDRIIEIAAIRTDGTGKTLDEFVTLVNPDRDLGRTDIHGITAAAVRQAPAFTEVVGDIVEILAGAVFVAHNVHFDMRFVEAEMVRNGCVLPEFPYLCTMQLSRRVDSNIPGRKLEVLCKHFGIPLCTAHSARDDARATAGLFAHCINHLANGKELSLAEIGTHRHQAREISWPSVQPSRTSCQRETATAHVARESSYIARLVALLPAASDTPEVEEYLSLLDKALEDRRITLSEADQLLSTSRELGMHREDAIVAHKTYMRDLIRVALEDNVISEAERSDLDHVRRLLDISQPDYEALLQVVTVERDLVGAHNDLTVMNRQDLDGKTICFTGTLSCKLDGKPATRSFAEECALEQGMIVRKNCTKTLDYLVAADPDSMSGKAKKARQYGIRILAEPVFWGMLGIPTD